MTVEATGTMIAAASWRPAAMVATTVVEIETGTGTVTAALLLRLAATEVTTEEGTETATVTAIVIAEAKR